MTLLITRAIAGQTPKIQFGSTSHRSLHLGGAASTFGRAAGPSTHGGSKRPSVAVSVGFHPASDTPGTAWSRKLGESSSAHPRLWARADRSLACSASAEMSPTPGLNLSLELANAGKLSFHDAGELNVSTAKKVVVVGKLEDLRSAAAEISPMLEALLEDLTIDTKLDAQAKTETLFDPATKQRITYVCLPETHSRNTAPSRPDLVKKALFGKLSGSSVVIASTEESSAMAVALALARCCPALSLKSSKLADGAAKDQGSDNTAVTFRMPLAAVADGRLQMVADATRAAQLLVDTPPCYLDSTAFEEFVRQQVVDVPGVKMEVLVGEELKDLGMGGLYGVGKAAAAPPRMIILSYDSGLEAPSACLVGKGIVFDTGGLSIKVPPNQQGMKADMGGAAGLLGAFLALARIGGIGKPLHCVLCVAENAVSEHALRNDDVITMYSGLTVEINNTDAEGRLVLGDGVAYCAKHLNPELVVDMATLTGAQGVSTGSLHGALYCNDAGTELEAVAAGIASGDYVFPLLYAPELHLSEFKSQVADMKNSVKNRVNAQSSCAGSFILQHLFHSGYDGNALHIDMAYPATAEERGTGYGVALICKLLKGI